MKVLGPFQEYVAFATALAVKLSVVPEQIVVLGVTDAVGAGVVFTVTVIVFVPVHPVVVPLTV